MSYTLSRIWEILVSGSDSVDEELDVQTGLMSLPIEQRVFIVMLANGHTSAQAMSRAGVRRGRSPAQGTQMKRDVLEKIARRIN